MVEINNAGFKNEEGLDPFNFGVLEDRTGVVEHNLVDPKMIEDLSSKLSSDQREELIGILEGALNRANHSVERWLSKKTLEDKTRERLKTESELEGILESMLGRKLNLGDREKNFKVSKERVEDYVELISDEYIDDIVEICDGEESFENKISEIHRMLKHILSNEQNNVGLEFEVPAHDGVLGFYNHFFNSVTMHPYNRDKDLAIFSVGTLVHEMWHSQQYYCISIDDDRGRELREAKSKYVNGGDNYFKYRENLLEKEACYAGRVVNMKLLDRYFEKHRNDEKSLYLDYFLDRVEDWFDWFYGRVNDDAFDEIPGVSIKIKEYIIDSQLPKCKSCDEFFKVNTMLDVQPGLFKMNYRAQLV